jgi:hypothetical protein
VRQAATALLGATVAASLETLIKGVLYAMITEKLKQSGIIFAMGVIALGTATVALLAYDRPPAEPGVVASDFAAQDGERNKANENKTVPTAKTTPEDPALRANQERLRAEAELEESYQKMDTLLADAALVQLDLYITTKLIEKTTEFLASPESRYIAEISRLTATERAGAEERLAEKLQRMDRQLRSLKQGYLTQWIALAQLKRKIVRQARILGVTTEIPPTGTELSRRLDGLEKKIDRIIDSLPVK